jgi:DNA topoisomerase-2
MATLANQYQKKTDKEHILDNPDTYIGSIENVNGPMYVYEDGHIVNKNIDYNPGLFKLFDEGIVNCRDHVVRMLQKKEHDDTTQLVNMIDIQIQDNMITLMNNGNGIDIEKHPTYDIWIPELIFGHLRTSTNYNKDEEKITGGKNGFGFKLVLIWSTYGMIETIDYTRKLKYTQEFETNLDVVHKPSITKCSKKPYTLVKFKPDYKRLGLNELSKDMIALFQRRVYDIAGITTKDVKVKLNGEALDVKNFNHYVDLYNDCDKISEQHERWSYSICLSEEFKQVSFVNGIFTSKGGKHVDYIVQQIVKKMIVYIEKKKKVDVKPSIIKEQLHIFLNCTIVNPSFDSQTKDYLNTPPSKFGSSCVVSDKFIEKLAKQGIMENSCELSHIKEKNNSKKTDGNKNKTIRGIPKLVDANYAGTKDSKLCTLILCEGDSAKAGILSGLTPSDRDIIGVYPMKGKLLNVRGETTKKINENKEIIEIKKIMGLESNKTYKNTDELRYNKILFMTDQDLDGSHIKGLCINLFECLWPSLMNIEGFLGFMNTPILKATKSGKMIHFYNEQEYELWKSEHQDAKGWSIKYYKGLGTSTGKEFKEYFKDKKTMDIRLGDKDIDTIDMVFNKKKSDCRKEWLSNYERNNVLDTRDTKITLGDFIHREMIHFSKYDCDRSIPNMMDGLKVSQRKILYSAFKKNLVHEIKVAQFSGYVSEHSGYHHGENSLNGAIVNMAQNFVGSNNINILMPNGQFGTRLQGGKDSASERYIFTNLNKITRMIFKKEDDAILTYLKDDGTFVEPIYYLPILPMILVNGTKGIGTGFSTDIPCFHPVQLINYIQHKLADKAYTRDFVPFYQGFQGTIEKDGDRRFITKGNYTIDKQVITITELPIGVWNEDYILHLEKCMDILKDYKDQSTDKKVYFKLTLKQPMEESDIIKTFKLSTTLSINNMNLFDHNDKLKHYNEVYEICDDFIGIRLDYYEKRRLHLIQILKEEMEVLKNKCNYINELLNDTLDLRKKTNNDICDILEKKKYTKINDSYHYLIKMSMDSVCQENVDSLNQQLNGKQSEYDKMWNSSHKDIWKDELEQLKKVLQF